MKFFDISTESIHRRRNSMSQQSFQAVRRLQEAGAPLPLVIANPAWQALLDKIDSNISERSVQLQDAISKLPVSKRPLVDMESDESFSTNQKRPRIGSSSADLDARKQALLSKLEENPNPADPDSYEAYRRQCWEQYYDWVDQQKDGEAASTAQAPPSADEDEEIHNALLGLS
jgi:hypothetical protein